MLEKRWIQWLIILGGMLAAGFGIGGFLYAQGSATAGKWIIATDLIVASAWVIYGLWQYRDRRWAKQLLAVFGGSYAIAVLCFLLVNLSEGQTARQLATAFAGAWIMTLLFTLGLALIRLILTPAFGAFAVARTLIDQAMRMKIVVVFIVGIGLLVPFLPLMFDEPRLEYRIQFFLTWSISVTSFLLSLMTIFLACGTICGEIREKQIFMTMSKPISRLQYLVGKWLGISLLNIILLAVAGSGIYAFTSILEQGAEKDSLERLAVEDQVLAARVSTQPFPAEGKDLHQMVEDRFQQLKREQPETYPDEQPNEKQTRAIQAMVMAKWHTIGPRNSEAYVFRNLPIPDPDQVWQQSDQSKWVELRFKPKAVKKPDDNRIRMSMRVNDRDFLPGRGGNHIIEVADDTTHHIRIPTDLVDENGQLEIRLFNLLDSTSINFSPGFGLELFHRVGGFEMNFLRSFFVLWVRLNFLAMLGLAAGTFLGFPVATLVSTMLYAAAAMSEFLNEAIRFYTPFPSARMSLWGKAAHHMEMFSVAFSDGEYYNCVKVIVRIFGSLFMSIIPPFAEFDPVELLADGQIVPNIMIYDALWQVGLIATGATFVFAWLVFRRRELARITA